MGLGVFLKSDGHRQVQFHLKWFYIRQVLINRQGCVWFKRFVSTSLTNNNARFTNLVQCTLYKETDSEHQIRYHYSNVAITSHWSAPVFDIRKHQCGGTKWDLDKSIYDTMTNANIWLLIMQFQTNNMFTYNIWLEQMCWLCFIVFASVYYHIQWELQSQSMDREPLFLWWRHQIWFLHANGPLWGESSVDSPYRGQWRRALMFS